MAVLRGEPSPYEFSDDVHGEFSSAVRNNQPNMAMHYLALILEEVNERLEALEGRLAVPAEKEVIEDPAPVVKQTTKKKAAKKAATKKQEEEELVDGDDT